MKNYFLLLFLFIVLLVGVRAICCDTGCYPDANCCGGSDGMGYVGCEKSPGGEFQCPLRAEDGVDPDDGTVLEGGDACLVCRCNLFDDCWWDDTNDCPGGYTCLADPDTILPQTSWCVTEDCPTCDVCQDLGQDCTLDKCHTCDLYECYYEDVPDCHDCSSATECRDFNDDPNACNGEIAVCDQLSCYWDDNLLGDNCKACSIIGECNDYDDNNRNTCDLDPCVLGDCFWTGSRCAECDITTECEDYEDQELCELDPCPGTGDCGWDGSECITKQPGYCNHDNTADRGEACDGTDLRDKDCEDFGLEGDLCCVDCEYDFECCTIDERTYPLTSCGDGNLDPGEVCDNGYLDGKTCFDFDDFISGELDCYDTCEFDTRMCGICNNNGNREIGEVCDCGGASCSQEQLNYKGCSDFDNYNSGDLGCSNNCEYDFTNCEQPAYTCDNDDSREDGEACDCGVDGICEGDDLGGKDCEDFDDFISGTLQCTDQCMFDTRKCEIPDADEMLEICELKHEGYQGGCNSQGDSWCWDPDADDGDGECCGDDQNEDDEWLYTIDYVNYFSCCTDSYGDYVFQTDPDYSGCFCNLRGVDAGICDVRGETFCWNVRNEIVPKKDGMCCGDDLDEGWSYSTPYKLNNVLVEETCYDKVWEKREELGGSIVFYDLSAGLT